MVLLLACKVNSLCNDSIIVCFTTNDLIWFYLNIYVCSYQLQSIAPHTIKWLLSYGWGLYNLGILDSAMYICPLCRHSVWGSPNNIEWDGLLWVPYTPNNIEWDGLLWVHYTPNNIEWDGLLWVPYTPNNIEWHGLLWVPYTPNNIEWHGLLWVPYTPNNIEWDGLLWVPYTPNNLEWDDLLWVPCIMAVFHLGHYFASIQEDLWRLCYFTYICNLYVFS